MKNSIEISRFGKNQLKHKKKKWIKPVLRGIIIVLFALLSVKCEEIIRCNISKLSVDNDANATWVGSLASYWGAIIDGIFSGIIAVFGVLYTIQFTREADRKKERQRIQPFPNIEIVGKSSEIIKKLQIADEPEYVVGKTVQELLNVQTYKMGKGITFFIWFADSMTNEYVQYYMLALKQSL